ncbi:hypothetical protein HDU97_003776 [Phlyctochytrium planicorne]|nr:hypothetical protein HDU97_003776 [Phlyctochytrium planicorne]
MALPFPTSAFAIDPATAPESFSANPFRPVTGLGYLLRFGGIEGNAWMGTLLVLQEQGKNLAKLTIHDEGSARIIDGVKIDSFGGHDFVRYSISLPLGDSDRKVEYEIPSRGRKHFHIPSKKHDSNASPIFKLIAQANFVQIAFWSCNGFGGDAKDPQGNWGGIQPMWRDLLRQHQQKPFHVQIGGGDQLYADGTPHSIFKDVPLLVKWLETEDIHERFKVQWTKEHEKSVADFYFLAYIYHFQEAEFSEALATIPYTFVCDDHDLLDGYGSYPDFIRDAPIMRNAGRLAYRFYLLFQHHTTFAEAEREQFLFPAPVGYSWLKASGPSTSILAIDSRVGRTETQVVAQDAWNAIYARLDSKLSSAKAAGNPVKHLLVVATVPVVYPRMKLADTVIETVSAIEKNVRSVVRTVSKSVESLSNSLASVLKFQILSGRATSGIGQAVVGSFGQPELRDDLIDEWTHPNHLEERNHMVQKLQEFSEKYRVRVTFLSGDVHICGFGRFRSENFDDAAFAKDHRGMVQVVSSAIGNNPPPPIILKYLHTNNRVLPPKESGIPNTVEEMFETFRKDVDGKDLQNLTWLLNRRNWSSITPDSDNSLAVDLHVENLDREQHSVLFPIQVPALI